MEIQPSRFKGMGAEVLGIDVETLGSDDVAHLMRALYKHKLLVLREQSLDTRQYIALARKIGQPQVYFQRNYHHPHHPEIFVSSNITEGGQKVGVAGTGRYWHNDYQFALEPLSTTMVYPQVLPSTTRDTYYMDLVAICKALPPDLREHVVGRRAIHEGKWRYKITAEDIDRALIDVLTEVEQELAPAVSHPAIITHPVTGKDALYISSGFTTRIKGLAHGENTEVLSKLFDFCEQERFVHTHSWCEGDILFWDNRVVNHRAGDTTPGEKQKSYRIGVYDAYPFYTNGESSREVIPRHIGQGRPVTRERASSTGQPDRTTRTLEPERRNLVR